jgi:hypothetical protein
MSLAVSKQVWEHFNEEGGNVKLALLCLADHADDEGNAYPSMARIARKLACSESQARRAVHRLIDLGVLQVMGNAAGGAPGTCRKYRIDLQRLTAGMDATPSAGDTPTPSADATPPVQETGSTDAREGLHGCAPTPSAGDTRTVIELPRTRKAPSRRKDETTLTTFLAQCREVGEQPIPPGDPVWDYAEKVGLPSELLELCWKEFRDRHLGDRKSKRQRDWRATFRNCVRGNWYRLWYVAAGGSIQTSSAGRITERAHAAA